MSDYERIAEAIAFITRHAGHQPDLEQVAAHVHLSRYHFQRLFARWAGITPKRFLQLLTLEHAKQLLRQPRSLLEVADEVGLSSASRLYDHFVQLDGVTPGEYRRFGEGVRIAYAIHASPFGEVFAAATPRGVCTLEFLGEQTRASAITALRQRWPKAQIVEDAAATRTVADALEGGERRERPLSLHVAGTNFQINVWRALLRIPAGSVATYAEVARAIGHPGAARAVGNAVASNPVALLIPCHRVITESGRLSGYRWGDTRKQAILGWEAARMERAGDGEAEPSAQ